MGKKGNTKDPKKTLVQKKEGIKTNISSGVQPVNETTELKVPYSYFLNYCKNCEFHRKWFIHRCKYNNDRYNFKLKCQNYNKRKIKIDIDDNNKNFSCQKSIEESKQKQTRNKKIEAFYQGFSDCINNRGFRKSQNNKDSNDQSNNGYDENDSSNIKDYIEGYSKAMLLKKN